MPTLASAANLPIRMVSLVSAENLAHAESAKQVREIQIAAAEENLVLAARSLPDAPEIESLVADGLTLESALKKLNWDDTDVRWWAPAGSRRRAGSFSALQRPASSPAPMPRSS